ncbi:hypothetical protein QEH59_07760 [Coraliomargarita sp. SDUM461004]|uniref:Spermidine synthase n=1 Tax=Thalassobacterium sedimentorum TaxID=3041258 RepID=A0ABU1AKP7_9BACT|nr:hypothetical protein [Coraliomargarita sp. SDUM461004]MDQ8194316.1 hypothetical protein [Coraliomargarita sp. SDUM461004]
MQNEPSSPARNTASAYLTAITVILAPALSFSIQPITGKYLLPILGGTATTWLSTLIFFQACVLIGYLSAFAIVKMNGKLQSICMAIFAILSVILLKAPPEITPGAMSIWQLILGLSFSLIIPVTFLFTIGVVLHEWLGVARGHIPWYLYALSNLGSILALLIYPFWIEPNISLEAQSLAWRISLGLLALLVLSLCVNRWHLPPASFRPKASNEDAASRQRILYWLLLAFLSCLLFMATTRELTAELGSHPLAWVLPLAIYLGAFSLTFSGFWGRKLNIATGIVFVITFTAYVYKQGLAMNGLDARSIQLLLLNVAAGCVFLNGTLYQSRSQSSFTSFYIMIALGGCLAGLFSTLIAPYIFNRNYEFQLAAFLSILIVISVCQINKPILKLALLLVFLSPACWLLSHDLHKINAKAPKIQNHFMRSIYSQNILTVAPGRLSISSEATLHGSEITQTDIKGLPTTYYHLESPIGMVFEYLNTKNDQSSRKIGVIGLGAGTLAYYGRQQDHMVFWDIDPSILQIAENFFNYLSNSPATTELRLADGRIGIRELDSPLQMLIVDAFTGDAVPSHLLTKEAFSEFSNAAPNGWIIYHISSRWMEVTPVLQANLEASKRRGVRIMTIIPPEVASKTDYRSASYIVIPPIDEVDKFLDFLRPKADSNPYVSSMFKVPSNLRQSIPWTDSQNSITDLLLWSKFL